MFVKVNDNFIGISHIIKIAKSKLHPGCTIHLSSGHTEVCQITPDEVMELVESGMLSGVRNSQTSSKEDCITVKDFLIIILDT